jgi:pheromone shutdown-related protein TraB
MSETTSHPEAEVLKAGPEKTTDLVAADDVRTIVSGDRRIILVGTAHISQESADLVREVISREQPDEVCVELDERRYQVLSEGGRWEALDLRSVIRQKQLATLILNLLLSAYQKRLGAKLGAVPGLELLEATKVAREMEIPVRLCDRDVRVTLRRAWYAMSFREKFLFMGSGLAGVFDKQELTEEDLRELRHSDVLSDLLNELGRALPVLKRVLLDERDAYLAQKIRESRAESIVAVVGAGHLEGTVRALEDSQHVSLDDLEIIPPPSRAWRIVGWAIPILILTSLGYIGWTKGAEAAGANALFWVLANGIPSAFGALVAWGHPLTILTSFVLAPLTSLTPVIGVGYVAAFVQAWLRPPLVRELKSVGDDVVHVQKWWQNRLLRILLVFILSSLGGVLGTYVGAYEIVSNLF